MPLPLGHAAVPLAGALVIVKRPVPWKLLVVAVIVAVLPDVDSFTSLAWGTPRGYLPATLPPWYHRGAAHSLFVALAVGLSAAAAHKLLRVRALTAGVVVGLSMASHGLLDMFTDFGEPVAYLWPVSSVRLFADWRPIHSGPVSMEHVATELPARFTSELWQLVIPAFAAAMVVRVGWAAIQRARRRKKQFQLSRGADNERPPK